MKYITIQKNKSGIIEDGFNGEQFLAEKISEIGQRLTSVISKDNGDDSINDTPAFHYNNFFISGDRGTGKTTVLKRLRSLLCPQEAKQDDKGEEKKESHETKELKEKFKSLSKQVVVFPHLVDFAVLKNTLTEYFLSWAKKRIQNSDSGEQCCRNQAGLETLLYQLTEKFPKFYLEKEDKEKDCEVWDYLDSSDLEYRKLFFEFVEKFLEKCYPEKKSICIFVDDIDLIDEDKILRFLNEVYYFFSTRRIIVMGFGHRENLVHKMKRMKTAKKSLYRDIMLSYLEKSFPIGKLTRLERLTYPIISGLKVFETEGEKLDPGEDEVKKLPLCFEYIKQKIPFLDLITENNPYIKILFNDISLRQLVQVLQKCSEKGDMAEKKGLKAIEDLKKLIEQSDCDSAKTEQTEKEDDSKKPPEYMLRLKLIDGIGNEIFTGVPNDLTLSDIFYSMFPSEQLKLDYSIRKGVFYKEAINNEQDKKLCIRAIDEIFGLTETFCDLMDKCLQKHEGKQDEIKNNYQSMYTFIQDNLPPRDFAILHLYLLENFNLMGGMNTTFLGYLWTSIVGLFFQYEEMNIEALNRMLKELKTNGFYSTTINLHNEIEISKSLEKYIKGELYQTGDSGNWPFSAAIPVRFKEDHSKGSSKNYLKYFCFQSNESNNDFKGAEVEMGNVWYNSILQTIGIILSERTRNKCFSFNRNILEMVDIIKDLNKQNNLYIPFKISFDYFNRSFCRIQQDSLSKESRHGDSIYELIESITEIYSGILRYFDIRKIYEVFSISKELENDEIGFFVEQVLNR